MSEVSPRTKKRYRYYSCENPACGAQMYCLNRSGLCVACRTRQCSAPGCEATYVMINDHKHCPGCRKRRRQSPGAYADYEGMNSSRGLVHL